MGWGLGREGALLRFFGLGGIGWIGWVGLGLDRSGLQKSTTRGRVGLDFRLFSMDTNSWLGIVVKLGGFTRFLYPE